MLNEKKVPPRGILHIVTDEPFVGLERFEPTESLRPFVEHYWSVTWERQPRVLRETVPHPSVHFVLEPNASQLHGVHRRRFSRWIEGTGRVLGTKFRPGGFRAFLQTGVDSLTNQIVHPQCVFGPSVLELETQAVAMESAKSAFELVDSYLVGRNPVATKELQTVNQIVQSIADDRSIVRAEAIVERTGLGLRKLQRLFLEYVGVSPKWVIQRFRLIEAAERIRTASEPIDYATIALELGYADQPHFIRDFKAMIGMTPAKYRDSIRNA